MDAANIFVCLCSDQRTLTFVVVTAGKRSQDCCFLGGQHGGL